MMLGVFLGLHFWDLVACLDQCAQRIQRIRHTGLAAPPGLHTMPAWHAAVLAEHCITTEGPRRVILQRLIKEGDAALELLAALAGVSKREALARVLGPTVVQANAVAWRL